MGSFVKNIAKFSLPTVASALVALLCIPLVSRVVDTDAFAVINLFFDYGALAALLCQMGMGDAFLRFYSECDGKEKRSLFTISLLVAIISAAVFGFVFAGLFPDIVSKLLFGEKDSGLLLFLVLYVAGIILYKFTSYRCRLDGAAFQYNIEQIAFIVINRVGYVIPLLIVGGVKSAVAFMTGFTLVVGVASLLNEPRPIFVLRKTSWKKGVAKLFEYGLPTVLLAVSTNLFLTINKVLVANLSSFSEAGVFSLSITIANCFSFIPAAFNVYWAAYVYRNYVEKQNEISKMHDCVMAISVVLVSFIFLLQEVIYSFVGPQYEASQGYFMLVMLLPIQAFISETTSYGINLSGRTIWGAIAAGGALLFDGLLCAVLVPDLGALGGAVAFASGAVVLLVLRTIAGQRYYRTVANPAKSLASLILIVGLCAINYALCHNDLARLIIFAAMLFYVAVVYKNDVKFIIEYLRFPVFSRNRA